MLDTGCTMPLHLQSHHRIRLLGLPCRYLLMTLILCAFAFQSWNVSRKTENAAYELVRATSRPGVATNRLDIPAPQHWSPRLLAVAHNLHRGIKTRIGQKEPPRSLDTIGARSLHFHDESVQAVMPTPSPSSGWIFDGMLAPDGSISSSKLMMEGDHFADYHPQALNTSRQPSNSWYDVAGSKSSAPSHRQQQQDSNEPNAFDKKYPPCQEALRDLIPCLNASGHLYGHCPNINRGPGSCAISAPAFYARQFKWPASKNQIRGPNVPNVPILRNPQQQAWMTIQGKGNTIHFRDGDPKFPEGSIKYVNHLAMMLPDPKFGSKMRVVLDIECGTGNMAAAFETQGVLALSIAGEDSADNGVQLVVERGYPALVQSFAALRLPYPSQAFDLIHCAACDVQWEKDAGLKLLEADRILRAGGFFVWLDPSKVEASWNGRCHLPYVRSLTFVAQETRKLRAQMPCSEMEELTKNICWSTVARWGNCSIWQKPTNQTCYLMRTHPTPPLCDASLSPDTSWNVPMQGCLGGLPETGGAITYPWPIRLETPPLRLEQAPAAGIEAAKAEAYKADLRYWMYIVAFYVDDFGPARARDIHNVLDMNAGYGGFAAAVSLKTPPLQWWVLNVVPVDQPDRLAVIFDRGLLGVYHDWCESLDVYPRTFDLVHSSGLFSSTSRCDMSDIVQEMDRLLRPGGFAIIRDKEDVLLQVQIIVRTLHWKATVEDTDSGPKGKDKVLSCQKTFWRPNLGKNGKGQ